MPSAVLPVVGEVANFNLDFNGKNPAVFAGSPNLSTGGEHENGDDFVVFRDPDRTEVQDANRARCRPAQMSHVDHSRVRASEVLTIAGKGPGVYTDQPVQPVERVERSKAPPRSKSYQARGSRNDFPRAANTGVLRSTTVLCILVVRIAPN